MSRTISKGKLEANKCSLCIIIDLISRRAWPWNSTTNAKSKQSNRANLFAELVVGLGFDFSSYFLYFLPILLFSSYTYDFKVKFTDCVSPGLGAHDSRLTHFWSILHTSPVVVDNLRLFWEMEILLNSMIGKFLSRNWGTIKSIS